MGKKKTEEIRDSPEQESEVRSQESGEKQETEKTTVETEQKPELPDGKDKQPDAPLNGLKPEEMKEMEKPELPKSRFRQIAAEKNDDNSISIISAWDIPWAGLVMRTLHIGPNGQAIGITEIFIPNAGIRDGKIVRSMV